jgi:hypothetical protein
MIKIPGIESEVKGVRAPTQLPCAEVSLPALFVQVGKNQEKQQGHDARHDRDIRGKTIHGAQDRIYGSLSPHLPGDKGKFVAFIVS